MRLCFNIDMPDTDLCVSSLAGDTRDTLQRSDKGYSGRQYKRFMPLIKCLETLVNINLWQLARFSKEGRPLPPLYDSGIGYKARNVFYQLEPSGQEEWLDIPTLYKQGYGDCEDLACARAGELRFTGIGAVPAIRHKKIPTSNGVLTLVHVLVLWPDGTVEDPSKLLGMKGEY